MRNHLRIADAHRPAGVEIDASPDSHVLVWRCGVPIHPIDGKVIFGGSKNFEGQDIVLPWKQQPGDIEFEDSVRACNVTGVSPERTPSETTTSLPGGREEGEPTATSGGT